jgi:hypothetical protein
LPVHASSVPEPPSDDAHDAAWALVPAADQRAAASAAGWLRAAGLLGGAHLLCCSYLSCATFLPQRTDLRELLALAYGVGYLFQGIASLFTYNAGKVLELRTSRRWVQFGGGLAVVMGVLALLMAAPAFRAVPGALQEAILGRATEDSIYLLAVLLCDAALVFSFLLAGSRALLVLARPAVYDSFRP